MNRIRKTMKDDFVYEPVKYWKEIYAPETNRPLLVLGGRSVMKYEVALQICKFLDEDFTVEKNVVYDVEKSIKTLSEEGCYLIPSFTGLRTHTDFSNSNFVLESC